MSDETEVTETPERDMSLAAAVERVLAHAEANGEVYVGACADHAVIRDALTDHKLA